MERVIVVVGPTGVGKTKMSVELAKRFNGEVINADSMQVYKELNIGTAKIKESEKDGISHHLFDIKEVTENYTVYDYQKDARNKITEITNNHKSPIMVGGTGLYIKACLYNYEFKEEIKSPNNYYDMPKEELYELLLKLDPTTIIHINNKQRIIRALNYYNENKDSIGNVPKSNNILYDAIVIGLTTNRSVLYERINTRVDKMIDEGLTNEVKSFYDKGIRSKSIMTGIGYKELYKHFDNEISLEEAIDLIKKNSRHYAKRQYTFFNNQLNVKWFDIKEDFNETIKEVCGYIKSNK